jgi:hypothetical protein
MGERDDESNLRPINFPELYRGEFKVSIARMREGARHTAGGGAAPIKEK